MQFTSALSDIFIYEEGLCKRPSLGNDLD